MLWAYGSATKSAQLECDMAKIMNSDWLIIINLRSNVRALYVPFSIG